MPLDLFLKAEMLKANYRIKPHFDNDWTGMGSKTKIGHVLRAKVNETFYNIPSEERDEINEPVWDKPYLVDNKHEGTDIYKGLRCYTDGSKTKSGAGAGVCIAVGNHILRTRSHGLSKHATVMQTELHAIRLACEHIADILDSRADIKTEYDKIVILTDSRAAMAALNQIDTKSKTVKDTKEALSSLSNVIQIEIKWIMSHKGIIGNVIADRAAFAGTKLRVSTPTTQAKAAIKQQVNDICYAEWNERWQTQANCRQTRLFLPTIDRGKSKKIMQLSKSHLGILVRYVTGHAHLDRHRRVMGDYGVTNTITHDFLNHINGITPQANIQPVPQSGPLDTVDINLASSYGTCRLCCIRDSEETPIHLALECPYTWRGRADLFMEYDPSHQTFLNWEPLSLVNFFAHYDLENLS